MMFNKNLYKRFNLAKSNIITICEKCGKPLIDRKDFKNIYIHTKTNKLYKLLNGKLTPYKESPTNQWLITGRKINDTIYYRKICWDCYKDKVIKTVDVTKKAKKSVWYKKLAMGKFEIPKRYTSANNTFRFLFDVSDNDLETANRRHHTSTKEYWINRLGEHDGLIKYKELCTRRAYTNTLEYFIKEKSLTEEDYRKHNKAKANTIENFIKWYGEVEGKLRWKNYLDAESYSGHNLQYFIDKYGKTEGYEKYKEVRRNGIVTEKSFIKRYGEEEGKLRWTHYIIKQRNLRKYSNMSIQLFNALDSSSSIYKMLSKFATKNCGEQPIQYIDDKTKDIHVYFPDYLFKHKIIEFNGDYWHCNPKIYKKDYKNLSSGKLAKDIWIYDKLRKKRLEALGYKVFIVWESEFIKNKAETIKKCLVFLKS